MQIIHIQIWVAFQQEKDQNTHEVKFDGLQTQQTINTKRFSMFDRGLGYL